MANRSSGPLRRIVGERVDDNGVMRERLECGHEVPRREDVIGATNAARRRCRHCYISRVRRPALTPTPPRADGPEAQHGE